MCDNKVAVDRPRVFVDATAAHDEGRPEPTFPPPPPAAERASCVASGEGEAVEEMPEAGDPKPRPP